MNTVVGVRFKNNSKAYYFDPGDLDVKKDMPVIVETARGVEYGICVIDPREVTDADLVSPLKPILRIATEKDIKQAKDNHAREREAFIICQDRIRDHGLEMKLIDTEYTFDNSKILFYFTADGRVDFRELVKDLAGIFRTRIELRQVGVRDETKILGGMGICGRPLCCHSYLSDFVPVSIKMAKEQNLSLNPSKISGVCGRLMCCLANEEEVYEEQNRKLPSSGDYVTTVAGERGIVQSVDIFREKVRVLVQSGEDKELKEYGADEIRFKKRRKKGKLELTPEELEQLRALEPEDVAQLEVEVAGAAADDADFTIREKYSGKKGNQGKRDESSGDGKNKERNQNREGRERNRDRDGERDRNRERNKDADGAERNQTGGERNKDRDGGEHNRDRNGGERNRDRNGAGGNGGNGNGANRNNNRNRRRGNHNRREEGASRKPQDEK